MFRTLIDIYDETSLRLKIVNCYRKAALPKIFVIVLSTSLRLYSHSLFFSSIILILEFHILAKTDFYGHPEAY